MEGYFELGSGGILISTLNNFDFHAIEKEVEEIRKDFSQLTDMRPELIGQLQHSYALEKCRSTIERVTQDLAEQHNQRTGWIDYCKRYFPGPERKKLSVDLDSCWINFQQRYEYQPIHDHSGVYSYIIFYEIPYILEEEQMASPGHGSTRSMSGELHFHYVAADGEITAMPIPADKKWKKKIIIFPATLKHFVHPFYSSTDYRITISGNLALNYNPS